MGMIEEHDDVDPFGNENVNKMRDLLRRDNVPQSDGFGSSG